MGETYKRFRSLFNWSGIVLLIRLLAELIFFIVEIIKLFLITKNLSCSYPFKFIIIKGRFLILLS